MKQAKDFIRVRGQHLSIPCLNAMQPKVAHLVAEYIANQNCWPDCWINNEPLTETEKCAFVYFCLSHPQYSYNPFK